MLPKVHLTLHSRMSGSRWVITPSWLSGPQRSLLYSSSVYSCHLFLVSSASVRSMPFLSFIVPIISLGKKRFPTFGKHRLKASNISDKTKKLQPHFFSLGFPGGSDGKQSACNAGYPSSMIHGSGRSPGEGNGYPLQYCCLENSIDRGAWQATVHGVTKSWTRPKDRLFISLANPR